MRRSGFVLVAGRNEADVSGLHADERCAVIWREESDRLFRSKALYDAQFSVYDTFIDRTTTDAIALTRQRQGGVNNFFHRLLPAGLRNRPYRFWYFVVVTVAVLAGLWMVLQTSPFIIWLAGSVAYLINQGIGCVQIMLINNRRLHPEFHIGRINIWLLPLATLITRLGASNDCPDDIAPSFSRILGRCPSLLIALPAIESTMGAGGAAIAGRPAPRAPARSPRLGA